MNLHSLHDAIVTRRAISPAAAVADNTPFVSQIIDMQGYEAMEFVLAPGALADTDATFTVLVEDGDASNLSDAAAVADDSLLGLESEASFTFAGDDTTKKIGYRGSKRYVRMTVTPANNTGNVFLAAVALMFPGSQYPVIGS
jgi:hypothetical protein